MNNFEILNKKILELDSTQKLEIYHAIWNYLHSEEFLELDFNKELEIFEQIIRIHLNGFCACGIDAQYIITYLINFYSLQYFDTKEKRRSFWCLFHNLIRTKLNQEIIVHE